MDADFWEQKWARNEIGFHQADIHPMLLQHWSALALAPGSRVFVPLCGKSNDLVWLRARGHAVVGVELSMIAVEAFFAGLGLDPTRSQMGPCTCLEAGGYTLLCGDFFALSTDRLGVFAGVYDRAALIALPRPMRRDYAAHLTALSPAATAMLTVLVDYDDAALSPPPFVVGADEMTGLFAADWTIACLGRGATAVKGLAADETAWLLHRRGQ